MSSNFDPNHECSYKELYFGAQRSLTDLATKQTAALGKYGRLRQGVVKVLKRYFPDYFAAVEIAGNFRVSDVSDAALINFMEEFITNAQLDAVDSPVLGDLRVALEEKGFDVSSCSDLSSIVDAIKSFKIPVQNINIDSPSTTEQFSKTAEEIVHKTEDPAWVGLEDLFDEEELEQSEQIIKSLDENAHVNIDCDNADDDFPSDLAREFEQENDVDDFSYEKEKTSLVDHSIVTTPPSVSSPQPALFIKPTALLTSKSKSQRTKKPIRVEAKSNQSITSDILFNDDIKLAETDLTDEIRSKLTASVLIPRPVFVQDIIGVAGARDLVEDWVTEISQKGRNSEFKFVSGKARHRERGALVFPVGTAREMAPDFANSWWEGCLNNYKGSALYEIAVLLHRVGDKLVSANFDKNCAVLRVQQGNGLVGIVVSAGRSWSEGGRARESVIEATRDIIKERLELVAVLSTSQDTLQPIIDSLSTHAEVENWQSGMPVIAALSWKWAEDDKHSAHLIVG